MMGGYARGTEVSESRSLEELRDVIQRYGADKFGYAEEPEGIEVGFKADGLMVRFRVPMPLLEDAAFRLTPKTGKPRSKSAQAKAYMDERKRRMRSLVLLVKAKLVGVRDGVVTFEEEFLPYVLVADGRTVAEAMTPMIEGAKSNKGVLMLPGPKGGG